MGNIKSIADIYKCLANLIGGFFWILILIAIVLLVGMLYWNNSINEDLWFPLTFLMLWSGTIERIDQLQMIKILKLVDMMHIVNRTKYF